MKIHRFIGDFDLSGKTASISGDAAAQIRSVLRLSKGEKIVLSDGKGKETMCEITLIDHKRVLVDVGETSAPERELGKRIVLFASMVKKENFELIAQKAVECGVEKIVPVISERTVKLGLNMERLEKIVREAAEQSGRVVIPEVVGPVSFADALTQAEGKILFFHLGGREISLGGRSNDTVSVFIGPEGGFSDAEAEAAKNIGAEIISLGDLTLRAETAAIIASYIVRYV